MSGISKTFLDETQHANVSRKFVVHVHVGCTDEAMLGLGHGCTLARPKSDGTIRPRVVITRNHQQQELELLSAYSGR